MAMTEADVQKLFNSWSAKTVASILVDGQKINDVFGTIKQQLDYLLQRQNSSDQKLKQFMESSEANGATPVVSAAVPTTEPARRLSSIPPAGAGIDPLLVESLRSEMDNVKLLIRNSNEQTDKKITTLDKWTQSQLKAIEQKLDQVAGSVKDHKQVLDSNLSRLDQIEANYRQLSHMLNSMSEQFNQHESSINQQLKDTNIQLNAIKDSMSVLELRSKHFENRVSTATSMVDKLNTIIESYPSKYFNKIHQDIELLQIEKASRADLETKADINMLFMKADQNSLSALEVLADELERRLANLKQETTDKFGHLDAKMDRRVDKIVAYCLKELRKELKAMTTHGDEDLGPDGTDIGKVRCLVCNQATNQRGNTEIVFGGPQLRTTMRPRQRSNSPPANRRPQSPQDYSQRPMASEGAPDYGNTTNMNTGSNKHRASHSRLVKMGAMPEQALLQAINNNEDDVEDFHYRTSSQKIGLRLANNAREETEGTLVHITSKQHIDGYKPTVTPTKNATPTGYKDVEEYVFVCV